MLPSDIVSNIVLFLLTTLKNTKGRVTEFLNLIYTQFQKNTIDKTFITQLLVLSWWNY